jgi:hypothetical protein
VEDDKVFSLAHFKRMHDFPLKLNKELESLLFVPTCVERSCHMQSCQHYTKVLAGFTIYSLALKIGAFFLLKKFSFLVPEGGLIMHI